MNGPSNLCSNRNYANSNSNYANNAKDHSKFVNNGSNNNGSNSDSMLSLEEDEEDGEPLEELSSDVAPDESPKGSCDNGDQDENENKKRHDLDRMNSDNENNIENLSKRLVHCWHDLYYDTSSNQNEEKIYEDLCYITFSSSRLPEVICISNLSILFSVPVKCCIHLLTAFYRSYLYTHTLFLHYTLCGKRLEAFSPDRITSIMAFIERAPCCT